MGQEKIESLDQAIIDTPQSEIAASLGLKAYKLNTRDIEQFRKLLLEVHESVHSWPKLEGQAFAEHMLQHEKEINAIFDRYPLAWRFPVYMERDIYFLYNENMGADGRRIFRNIMYAWQWYAFFRAKKGELSFFKTANIFDGNAIQAQNYLDNAIRGTWGSMQGTWIESLGLGSQVDHYNRANVEAVDHFVSNMSSANTTMFRDELGKRIEDPDLSFEILFIYNDCHGARPETYVPQLNFLLCQTQMFAYKDIVTYSTSETAYAILPVWCHWIGRYFPELMSHDSMQKTLFDFAFQLDGSALMKDGKVSSRHKRKDGLVGLPPVVVRTLENCYPKYRESVGRVRRSISRVTTETTQILARINTSSPVSSPQVAPPVKAQKITINVPDKSSLFIRSGEKKQLAQLDLSGVSLPEGTAVQFERQLPRGKRFETLPVERGQLNEITPILGQENKGQFMYRLTIVLSGEYRFPDGKTKTILEHKIYAEADPTPEEIEAQKNKKTAPIQPVLIPQKTASSLAPAVKTAVTSVLETPLPKQKSIADTMTAWELVIQEGSITPELRDDGVIIFHLSDEFVDELHDASFEVLQISPDSTIHPDIGVGDFASQLQDIARELREKKQAEYDLALQVEQEEKEYQMLREQFQPFYDFIGEQTFVDKNNKALFDKASEGFKISLKSLGWSMPWRITKDGQIQFRHTRNDIKITYSNLGVVIHVVGEIRALSKAEERCYREIAEAFSHLALFYTADYRERQSMISKEKKFHRDMASGAEKYERLLQKNQARLVGYSSEGKGNIFVSKFPLDDKPQMLCEKVGHATVEEILLDNKHAELCYRRDVVRINGEISEDAGEQSLENTLQNLADLRQSPRARYILRKRILITLGLEKFTEDDTRAPLQQPQKGESQINAFEILQSLKAQKNIESKEQIDEEFMDSYIDLLLQHRIRVQYVWPLSVSLADHRKQLEKIRKQKKTTAD